ncbi:nucleoid-associated protein [Leptospira levettii]|uniref:nucleoid-associated protein n=1 Tax=Leptospira levettii TaxID=2023178 RepID=UPI000C2A3A7C|nr:nucleoid-associated protein [Leptospira levettii]PJZ86716.1 nucleoid-associated protein NdpA [Leptospira levettii]
MLIEKVIIHWVPKSDSSKQLKLSENFAAEVDSGFWKRRIEDSLESKNCYEIEFIGNDPSDIGAKIRGLKAATTNQRYIEISKEIAQYLYSIQNRQNISDGFLIIIKGKNDNERAYISILKLEGIEGSEAKYNPENNSYDLKHLESILLTEQTKVFKMAYFEFDGHSFMKMYAMDDQINKYEIADFWLIKFLGSKLPDTPENLTKKVFEFVKDFSKSKRLTPEESIDLLTGLYSDYKSNRKTVKLSRIAQNHVPAELLEHFNDKASKNDIPTFEFEKRISPFVQKKLTVRKFILEEEIIVNIPVAVIESGRLVSIKETRNGKFLELKAKIEKEK